MKILRGPNLQGETPSPVGVALAHQINGNPTHSPPCPSQFKPGQFAEEDVVVSPSAKDEGLLKDLWDYSREATGASWDALRPIEQVAAPTNENA